MHRNFDRIAAIAPGMRPALEQADWEEAARLLREEWTNRKKNAPGITTPLIDRLIDCTAAGRRDRGEGVRGGRRRMRAVPGGAGGEGQGVGIERGRAPRCCQ